MLRDSMHMLLLLALLWRVRRCTGQTSLCSYMLLWSLRTKKSFLLLWFCLCSQTNQAIIVSAWYEFKTKITYSLACASARLRGGCDDGIRRRRCCGCCCSRCRLVTTAPPARRFARLGPRSGVRRGRWCGCCHWRGVCAFFKFPKQAIHAVNVLINTRSCLFVLLVNIVDRVPEQPLSVTHK